MIRVITALVVGCALGLPTLAWSEANWTDLTQPLSEPVPQLAMVGNRIVWTVEGKLRISDGIGAAKTLASRYPARQVDGDGETVAWLECKVVRGPLPAMRVVSFGAKGRRVLFAGRDRQCGGTLMAVGDNSVLVKRRFNSSCEAGTPPDEELRKGRRCAQVISSRFDLLLRGRWVTVQRPIQLRGPFLLSHLSKRRIERLDMRTGRRKTFTLPDGFKLAVADVSRKGSVAAILASASTDGEILWRDTGRISVLPNLGSNAFVDLAQDHRSGVTLAGNKSNFFAIDSNGGLSTLLESTEILHHAISSTHILVQHRRRCVYTSDAPCGERPLLSQVTVLP